MDIHNVKAGMFVEYHMSLAEVIAVDLKTESAVIEMHSDHQRVTANVAELFADRQLNSDNKMYYWGC